MSPRQLQIIIFAVGMAIIIATIAGMIWVYRLLCPISVRAAYVGAVLVLLLPFVILTLMHEQQYNRNVQKTLHHIRRNISRRGWYM